MATGGAGGASYALYIFHRDLRLQDNTTLTAAVKYCRENGCSLLPVFIFTPQQIDPSKNKYRSSAAIQFMVRSLKELGEAIRADGGGLACYYGDTATVVRRLAPVAVFETADYTPFARKRSASIAALGIPYYEIHDTYLTTPGTVLNGQGRPYQKFTPFYEAAKRQRVAAVAAKPRAIPWYRGEPALKATYDPEDALAEPLHSIHVHGGRKEGVALLAKVPALDYEAVHDIPAKDTTNLSAHNHFGTISIREFFHAADGKPALQRQLYWRDFYGHICAAFEDLYGVDPYKFQAEGQEGYGDWVKPSSGGAGGGRPRDRRVFNAWCRGETGVPIVDAAMKQLLTTGYMHNRARLIVANWLVKDQRIYWRWGERFFAKHLVDYDFAQNFGNWCWVASVLPFSQAPFRRLDADVQAKKFDSDGVYVKRWSVA